MSEIKEYLILLSVLIVPIGFSLFEKYYSFWCKEITDEKRNKLSGIWHAVKYWVITLSTINIFWAHGVTEWFRYIPLMMFIFWVIFDLWWNYTHRKNIGSLWPLYPGNGKGGFIEASIFWVSHKTKINFWLTMLIAKMIALTISIFIIINY